MSLTKLAFICVFTLFAILIGSEKAIAQHDTIITKQGDVLSGTIEGLSEGILLFKTTYVAEAINIKWSEVTVLQSKRRFLIFDKKALLLTGIIRLDSTDKKNVTVITKDTILSLVKANITEINKYENLKLVDKLKLRADIGFALAKANKSAELSLSINAAYTDKRWQATLDYLSYGLLVDTITSGRGNITAGLKYLLPYNWFIITQAGDFFSTEQQVDSRENIYLGFGKFFIKQNKNFLLVYAGGTYNREKFTTSPQYFKTAELFATTRSEFFIVKIIDLINEVSTYPSLTEGGRVRFNFNTDLKFTFAKHFSCGLGLVLNADTKPPVTSSKADYVINFKLGWKL